ncbi:MAG TPA: Fe-S cluster assembly protein IscX [Candidatus Kapabacteria bacterium]|nr:Fe-S cluster assembly protein IscX [Candidatus Kapabacteria bacterium]
MNWNNIEDIAEALFDAKPGTDPLTVRFTDLRDFIVALPDWDGDIHSSNESKLEAVQMAWYELWKDKHNE